MGKVVIVTGGARGIGKAIVRNLALRGNMVVANYNSSKREAENLKEELYKEGFNIDIFNADVSKEIDCEKLVEYVLNKYKRIDVLINNAGISQIKEFTHITGDDWNTMIKVNLDSVFYMSKSVIENMIKNKNGCIINISSIWGITGGSCEVHYSVSKAGVDAMTKSLAKEMGPCNIRVNSIAPGFIKTDMNKELESEEVDEIINQIPLGREGSTSDISKCVDWLIEDEYTTGQVISINGGWYI